MVNNENENKKDLVVPVEKEINDEIIADYSNEDVLNTKISDEDISILTENEAQIVASKVEVKIEKYENILMNCENQGLSEEEVIANGFDEEEYFALKELEKKIYKHLKSLRKKTKEGGFFGNMPVWAFVLFIVCALFTIIPVNPYFPLEIYNMVIAKFPTEFMLNISGAYLVYFLYLGFFVILELVLLVILFIKGRKAKEKMQSFKSFLVLVIINIIIDIPGLVIFLNAAMSY